MSNKACDKFKLCSCGGKAIQIANAKHFDSTYLKMSLEAFVSPDGLLWALPDSSLDDLSNQAEKLVTGASGAATQSKFDSVVDEFVEWGLKIGASL